MRIEWSGAALADLDRFVEFLNHQHPSLAATVATEIAVIASEAKQSRVSPLKDSGLLRFARNDGD